MFLEIKSFFNMLLELMWYSGMMIPPMFISHKNIANMSTSRAFEVVYVTPVDITGTTALLF